MGNTVYLVDYPFGDHIVIARWNLSPILRYGSNAMHMWPESYTM